VALRGRAFLALWHDIADAGEAEYNIWHTRQHMPERLGVPGFLVGRRAIDWNLKHQRWFTLYETKTLETLSSEEYRVRLNNPTHWSKRTQPNFLNFAHCACITSASVGRGTGGALATIRLSLEEGQLTEFEAQAEKLAHHIAMFDGVVGVHFGVAAPDTTRVKTRESELRAKTGEDIFDAVVIVDGVGRRELETATPSVQIALKETLKIASEQSAVYDLAYLLTAEDVA
jgi:hypothetical protein